MDLGDSNAADRERLKRTHVNDPADNVPEGEWEPYWQCECDACADHYADLADAINEERVSGLRPTRWSR